MLMRFRYASVSEIGAALRRRETSAEELARESLAGFDRIGRPLNAVANVLPERAALEARRADRRLLTGTAHPLTGVPYGAKDLFAARGGPTTWGSAYFAERHLSSDATVIRRLSRSGSVLVAKLAMSELAGGGRPSRWGPSMHGQGRNPWDRRRYSGGSSSGSAIAVACGLVPFALGSETGGSIVSPSGLSGVTGLRPTFGTVPTTGVMTLSRSLDKVGPIARSASDVATVMEALTSRFRKCEMRDLDGRRRSLRVAFLDAEIDEVDDALRPAFIEAVEWTRKIFPRFVSTGIDRSFARVTTLERIIAVEGAFEFRDLLTDPAFAMSDRAQQETLKAGLDVPARAYLEDLRVAIPRARSDFDAVFGVADVILTATRTSEAPHLDDQRLPRDPTKMSELLRAAANLAGVPGISIPCGLSTNGLPIGLQMIGPAGSDAQLVALAEVFQRATDFHLARPPESFDTALVPTGP